MQVMTSQGKLMLMLLVLSAIAYITVEDDAQEELVPVKRDNFCFVEILWL